MGIIAEGEIFHAFLLLIHAFYGIVTVSHGLNLYFFGPLHHSSYHALPNGQTLCP